MKLIALNQNLKRLESRVAELKAESEKYMELPPSISLAKIEMQKLKNEIDKIDMEIENNMNLIH